jgi:hypothetical protein
MSSCDDDSEGVRHSSQSIERKRNKFLPESRVMSARARLGRGLASWELGVYRTGPGHGQFSLLSQPMSFCADAGAAVIATAVTIAATNIVTREIFLFTIVPPVRISTNPSEWQA